MSLKRYNPDKRGSFQISVDFYDWELSVMVGALRSFGTKHKQNKAFATFLGNLEDKCGKALGKILKAEFKDIKVGETKPLIPPEKIVTMTIEKADVIRKAELLTILESQYQINRKEAEKLIAKLLTEGTIYTPSKGCLKIT